MLKFRVYITLVSTETYKLISTKITAIPCTEMQALKPKFLENRCTKKHAFNHIFIRIQVGYTVQHINIQKSYLNLNKSIAKNAVLWCIYFQVLGF